ncbi:MAG: hypothetical protein AAFR89_03735, partial [Cyanobacteria bacterium J06633_1]
FDTSYNCSNLKLGSAQFLSSQTNIGIEQLMKAFLKSNVWIIALALCLLSFLANRAIIHTFDLRNAFISCLIPIFVQLERNCAEPNLRLEQL